MNRLNKAIALFSLVALLSIAACVWEASDSEAATGDAGAPKYIIGTKDAAYKLVGSNNTVTGTIDFNKTALGDTTKTQFFIYKTGGEDSATASNSTTVDNFDVALNEVTGHDGRYTVNVTAQSGAVSAKIIVKLQATTEVSIGSDTSSVTQTYYWAINVRYDGTSRTIEIAGATGTAKNEVSFSYGTTISMDTGVYSGSTKQSGYQMYAVGLPDGLAMVQGADINTWTIGGRLSARFDAPTEKTFTIHAISNTGDVLSKVFTYDLTKDNSFGFGYELYKNSSITKETEPFVFVSSSADTLKLKLTRTAASPELQFSVTVNGTAVSVGEDGCFAIGINGTGTMTVEMTGSYLGNPVDIQSFNIYVVSGIFDSDLSPNVTSA